MRNRQRFIRGVALFLAALMLFSLVFAELGSVLASATGQSELDRLEQEKEALRSEKLEAGNKAASLREQKAAWVEQKESLDEQNRLAQEEILNTQKQIELYDQMIAEKQVEAEEAQAAADAQLEVYKKRLRAMEENGQFNTYMSVLVGAEDFEALLTRVDTLSEIMEGDKRIEQAYKDTRDAAIQVKAEYEQLNVEMEAKKAELEAEVEKLEAEIAEADKMIAEIQKDIDKYTALYNQAAASEAGVRNQISSILAAIQAEQNNQQSGSDSSGNGSNASSAAQGTGNYTWPLPSSRLVTSLYGNRMHPELGYERFHSGIDINASVGAAVVAADTGTVILVGNDPSGYGNYLVINHGGGKTTLYAHMSAIAVSKGTAVTKGQTIAYAGSSGLSTGPHLHFEIQINGGTVNPLGYFSGYSIWSEAY